MESRGAGSGAGTAQGRGWQGPLWGARGGISGRRVDFGLNRRGELVLWAGAMVRDPRGARRQPESTHEKSKDR
jgi:hypothetical protein